MKTEQEIKAAYDTFLEASARIPEAEFNKADACRIEGALDALNWVLTSDELASIFETNIKAFRNRLASHAAVDADAEGKE
jgi:hypothetical protein